MKEEKPVKTLKFENLFKAALEEIENLCKMNRKNCDKEEI